MKIIKEETSFMRDNVPALDVETTAVVDPTYKKAVDDREKIRKHLEDTLKDKEVRKEPILGTKEDKLNLEESLFEDINSRRITEDISNDRAKAILDDLINNLCEVDGVRTTIKNLIDLGVERNELVAMKFDKDEVEDVFDSLDESIKKEKKLKEAMIEIDDDDLLDLLSKELDGWKPEPDVKDLYMKMYENQIDQGVFSGGKFNASEIVDNDWVNWTDVISDGDDHFEDCLKSYEEGDYEVKSNGDYFGYIEAVDNESDPKMFLIRY